MVIDDLSLVAGLLYRAMWSSLAVFSMVGVVSFFIKK